MNPAGPTVSAASLQTNDQTFMHLNNPAAMFWAVVLIPIVLLYAFRGRGRRVSVATSMFWRQIPAVKQAGGRFSRPNNIRSLLLQLLFAMLLILALAEPFSGQQTRPATRMIVVLDNSLSMLASDRSETRFQSAVSHVKEMIQQLLPCDEMAILTAAGTPRIVCNPTDSQLLLESRLMEIGVVSDSAQMSGALEMAQIVSQYPSTSQDRGGGGGGGGRKQVSQIFVFTDGCFREVETLVRQSSVKWVLVGQPADNVAIRQLVTRVSPVDPETHEIHVDVKNHGTVGIRCELQLSLADSLIDVIPLKLDGDSSVATKAQVRTADGGILVASLHNLLPVEVAEEKFSRAPVNALVEDDSMRTTIPSLRKVDVTLVSEGGDFLQSAIEANSVASLTTTATVPVNSPEDGLLVVDRRPLQTVPKGNVLVVSPVTSSELWEMTGSVPGASLLSQNHSSPFLRDVRLEEIQTGEIARILPQAEHQILASNQNNDPLCVLFPREQGNVVVLTVNLEQSDLALRTAFPIFISNVLQTVMHQIAEKPSNKVSFSDSDEGNLNRQEVFPDDTAARSSGPVIPISQWALVAALTLTIFEWIQFHLRPVD